MPVVRFSWNPQLVDVRREACPRARWNSQTRAWMMTATEAEAFVTAGHHRLDTAGWLAKSWLMARSGLWGSFKGARERPRRAPNLQIPLPDNCLVEPLAANGICEQRSTRAESAQRSGARPRHRSRHWNRVRQAPPAWLSAPRCRRQRRAEHISRRGEGAAVRGDGGTRGRTRTSSFSGTCR